MILKPRLLPISPQMTPSQDDPPDADKFYWALGVANVAWGRLEGQFLTCLMLIIQIANDKHIGTKLPMKFKPQADLWKDAFEHIPSLKPFKRAAAAFLLNSTIYLTIATLWLMRFGRPSCRILRSRLKS
jgi:Na+-driven multidrug efflux pump